MDPELCQQVAMDAKVAKHASLPGFMIHLAGKDDMVSADGEVWRRWRQMFNPGFATQHLMSLVPGIVSDAEVFVSKLTEHAETQDVFKLEEATTRLTIDVIGKVALDLELNTQNSENEYTTAMREQVHLLPNQRMPFEMWLPWGIWRRWRNGKIMSSYIGKVVDERFAKRLAESESEFKSTEKSRTPTSRTILDLALDSYLSGSSNQDEAIENAQDGPPPAMDSACKAGVITQIRTFLFAGHDTTSSTLCYVFHLLSKHPYALQRVRAEHDSVLGTNKDAAAEVIRANPHILNKLEYTLAIIKETLRLYPVASGPRAGSKDLFLRDPKTGEMWPTEGYLVWLAHYGLHHNEDVWGATANLFDPDRFMPGRIGEIPEGAFRPFETGPRNCVGQNLALIEARVVLALTLRKFEFELRLGEEGGKRDKVWTEGKQDVDGEELYPVLIGAAKPREGMPVRVRIAKDVA